MRRHWWTMSGLHAPRSLFCFFKMFAWSSQFSSWNAFPTCKFVTFKNIDTMLNFPRTYLDWFQLCPFEDYDQTLVLISDVLGERQVLRRQNHFFGLIGLLTNLTLLAHFRIIGCTWYLCDCLISRDQRFIFGKLLSLKTRFTKMFTLLLFTAEPRVVLKRGEWQLMSRDTLRVSKFEELSIWTRTLIFAPL